MTSHRNRQFVLGLLMAVVLVRPVYGSVLVESVASPWAAVPSGIQAGDRLLDWERQVRGATTAKGTFRDPWDVRDFELEQLARGLCRVRLARGGQTIAVVVRSPEWGVHAGLLLADAHQQQRFVRGLARAEAHDIDGALALWKPLASDLASRQPRAAAWLHCRIGTMLIEPVGIGGTRWPKEWVEGKGGNDADRAFAEAVRIAHRTGDLTTEAMVFETGGRAWGEDIPTVIPGPMSFGRCRKLFVQAAALRRRIAPDSLSLAVSLQSLGLLWAHNDDGGSKSFEGRPALPANPALGRTLCREALFLYRKHAPGTYGEAMVRLALERIDVTANWWCGNNCGAGGQSVSEKLQRLDNVAGAVKLLQRAQASTETLAVAAMSGVSAAMSLDDFVGVVRFRRIEISASEQLEAANTAGRVPPATCSPCIDLFEDLNNFSVELSVLGLADESEAAALKSLDVARRQGMAERAWTYDNLARAAGMKGDRAVQQRYLLKSLELRQQEGGPEKMVGIYLELGQTANDETSATLLRQAIAVADTLKPSDDGHRVEVRDQQCNALVALAERRRTSAAELARLDSQCTLWADARDEVYMSDPYGYRKMSLSSAALARGDTARAIVLARDAVTLCRARSARARLPIALGEALHQLGRSQCTAGDHRNGIASLDEARRIFERIAPRSSEYLETLQALGTCQRTGGQPEQGAMVLERALALAEALPTERMTMGRAFDVAKRAATSKELAAALADSGREVAAFEALERGRAAVFRATLAGRGLTSSPVPKEVAARRAQLWLKYDLTQKTLRELPASATPAEVNGLQSDLLIVSGQLDVLAAEIARAIPASQSPNALTLDRVTRALPAGTVLVEFSVEADRTRVFVVDPRKPAAPLVVRTLPVTEASLSRQVALFRRSLERRGTASIPEAKDRGRQLYDQLFGPIDVAIADASQLLVVSDGPLYDLPFAALVRKSAGRSGYLIEFLPLSVAVSASESALVPQRLQRPAGRPVIAVGDVIPVKAGDPRMATNGTVRGDLDVTDETADPGDDADESADERAGDRSALPGSRREVENIARLLAPGVTTLLGAEASESRVKSVASSARILHFATHAITNNEFPLNTGLLLSPNDGRDAGLADAPDNGFLQAWEVIGQMHLDADLVTLSACESARGRAQTGEGALSLARAFQYAGARSVVSALWSIDDTATADLMSSFYAGLKEGLSKAEALRRAQLGFIGGAGRNERWAAPAYWAAFELSGDWR